MDSTKFGGSVPPDLLDKTTLISLASTVLILFVALALSRQVQPADTPGRFRFLFIWHAFDALIHFFLEGSFLYHCFFSWMSLEDTDSELLADTAFNFLGTTGRAYGSQAGGDNPFAQLWMVYAKADRRWAGADLTVISLELLTVFIGAPLACYICYLLAKKDWRANIWMIILGTAELYGGWMTFCPEWLTGSINLDTSNWMYLWLYLVFFNVLWVVIPFYAIYVSWSQISGAFKLASARKDA